MPALSVLQSLLQQQQEGPWLIFTQSTSPVEKIARFIASLPTLSISWHNPFMQLKHDQLIIDGDIKQTFWPIKGLRGDGIKLTGIQMIFTEAPENSYDVQVTADGEIAIGLTKILLRGELQSDNRFFFTLHDSLAAWLPLSRLVAFASDSHENEADYHAIQRKTPLKELQVTRFQVALGYEETARMDLLIEAVPASPATWEMINKDGKLLHPKSVVLENVAVRLHSSYIPHWHQFTFKGAIVGRLPLGIRTFPVFIPLHGGTHWECFVQPDEQIRPDLLTLAQWEDKHVGTHLRATLLAADLDAQKVVVDTIEIGFDARARELKYIATRNHAATQWGRLDFSVFLPDVQVNGHLAQEAKPPTVKNFVAHYFAASENFPPSYLHELTLDGDSANQSSMLHASVEEGNFFVGLLSLNQLRLTITSSQSGVQGLLLANCTVADVDVPLVCTCSRATASLTVTTSHSTGWQFRGEAEAPILKEKLFAWLSHRISKEDLVGLHALGEKILLVVEGDLAANTLLLTCTDEQQRVLLIQLTRAEANRFHLHITPKTITAPKTDASGYTSDESMFSHVPDIDDDIVLESSDDESFLESDDFQELAERARKHRVDPYSSRPSKRRRFSRTEGDI